MVQASVAKATKICPERLEVRRTARSLDSEINRLKAMIATQQDQQGDREEIVRSVTPTLASDRRIRLARLCHDVTFSHVNLHLSYPRLYFTPTFRQYHEALQSYKNMAQQMKNFSSFIKCLDNVLNQRLQVYGELRR